jgi:simple sugar transport system substrate-binding protein
MNVPRLIGARKGAVALATGLVVVAGSVTGITSAVTSAGASAPSSARCPYTFAVITHGDNGSFWSVVYKGAKDAAKDLGCTLSEVYGSQQQGQAEPDDVAENAQIQDAINAHVNGIAVSDHDPTLMNPTIAKAVAKGIPVVLLNAGCDPADLAASHAMTCVGQPETLAGQAAGAQFKSLGDTNVLCVIHQSGQNLLDRCAGVAAGLGLSKCTTTSSPPSSGPACTQLFLSTPDAASNPQQAVGQIVTFLQAHPSINGVMLLNSAISDALVAANPPKVKVATFDLDAATVADLKSGKLAFAIDQQQYLQGYLPIVFLYLYNKHEGNSAGGGSVVPSGPLVVTKANVGKVAAAIAAGDD